MRRTFNSGVLALGVIGVFYAWKNRFQIQRFLERQGIRTPLDTGNLVDTIRSGAAKVTGRAEGAMDEMDRSLDEGDRQVG